MFKKILLLFIIGFLQVCINPCLGQSIDKNDRGESIVVYPDGSWRHFDVNNPEDQRLMEQHLEKIEHPIETPPQEFEEEEISIQKNESELEVLILDAIDEEQDAIEQYELSVQKKEGLQGQLERLKKSEFSNKIQIKAAKERLNNAVGAERIAQKARDEASKKARKYEKIALMEPAQQEKALNSILEREAALPLEEISVLPDVDTALAKAKKEKKASKTKKVKTKKSKKKKKVKTKKPKKSKKNKSVAKNKKQKKKRSKKPKDTAIVKTKKKNKTKGRESTVETPSFGKTVSNFKQLGPEDDIILNPPSPDCVIAYEGVEEFTGKKRKDVAPAHFFSFTNENLRVLFKDKDMIECSGHVTSVSGGLKYLSVEMVIHDEKAQQNYGILEKGSILSIRLVDGTNIQLLNRKTNQGNLNRFEKYVTYHAQYRIGPDQEKALLKTEIDRVRVVWSMGYEEYEVFETDFMIHQLECLNQ